MKNSGDGSHTTALTAIYRKLYSHFGPQHWWPATTDFEVIIGAILTQNTNWSNVEKALRNLKKSRLLHARTLYRIPAAQLAEVIRPSGYYNIKAKRIQEFLQFFFRQYEGRLKKMAAAPLIDLRRGLLLVKGIGPETADSILLYALGKPVFVIDAYTKRMLSRHRLLDENASYDEAQNLFMQNLKNEVQLFNEYHALLVRLGKEFCRKTSPKCDACPLQHISAHSLQ